MIRVTVWNEFQHERTQEKVKEIYPDGFTPVLQSFWDKRRSFRFGRLCLTRRSMG